MAEPRRIDRPEIGWWLMRFGERGSALVPASILLLRTTHEPGDESNAMDRSAHWCGFINGKPVPWDTVWLRRGKPISRQEHDYLVADSAWSRQYAPREPSADPERTVNLREIAPIAPPLAGFKAVAR